MTGYRIIVRGEFCDALAHTFQDLHVEAGSGETTLTGEIVDQAQLHGILECLRNFGVELVALTPTDSGVEPDVRGARARSGR